ncbi:MAG TPA: ABC transporter ATP-binding protein [Vicinamibacterales bacterium]|jgi:NitT/TauT family transport system ATP-binding protein|nr:ABC transporter ATP-binding protein [Vicinamibacterales bacterium]
MRLTVSDLAVAFGTGAREVRAIDGLSFETRDGEFLSIMGPSGCGKTTLLRTLAGLARPRSGRVEQAPGPHDRLSTSLLVFQEDSVFPWMTVLENAAFGLRMQGVEREERSRRARRLLERFGLAGREHAYPHQLSLGMKQRVAVIRCLLAEPAVVLMDEPFAGLDAHTRYSLQRELLDAWEQDQKTVIFVTHDIEEALLLSDRILVLDGPPARVVDSIDVPFARPRGPGLPLEAPFVDLKRWVWTRLDRSLAAGWA